MKILSSLLFLLLLAGSCRQHKADPNVLTDETVLQRNMDQLTQVIIHDMFAPPNASRIYAYSSLAAYEAVRFTKEGYPSLTTQLHGFDPMPAPESSKDYNYLLSASTAFFTVAENITFSKDSMQAYKKSLMADFASLLDKETYERSVSFGEKIGQNVLERTKRDFYKETRGMPKFLGTNQRDKWQPTPPDYSDGAEPHWHKMRPLLLDSATQVRCPKPPPYSEEKGSEFYKNMQEVYTITTTLTEEQKTIARYWDDNPFVTEHAGHLMFGNKKITPVGHWMGITAIASQIKDADAAKTAQAFALASTAIYDAFISCWHDKYVYQVIRPVTVINETVDRNWMPYLQTPPFPEHASGHSAISAAAATVLTELFGEFPFEDTSDLPYIGMKRNFSSFHQAAAEASISRVYGGIHYRTGVDAGAIQGFTIGGHVVKKLLGKDAQQVAVVK